MAMIKLSLKRRVQSKICNDLEFFLLKLARHETVFSKIVESYFYRPPRKLWFSIIHSLSTRRPELAMVLVSGFGDLFAGYGYPFFVMRPFFCNAPPKKEAHYKKRVGAL